MQGEEELRQDVKKMVKELEKSVKGRKRLNRGVREDTLGDGRKEKRTLTRYLKGVKGVREKILRGKTGEGRNL